MGKSYKSSFDEIFSGGGGKHKNGLYVEGPGKSKKKKKKKKADKDIEKRILRNLPDNKTGKKLDISFYQLCMEDVDRLPLGCYTIRFSMYDSVYEMDVVRICEEFPKVMDIVSGEYLNVDALNGVENIKIYLNTPIIIPEMSGSIQTYIPEDEYYTSENMSGDQNDSTDIQLYNLANTITYDIVTSETESTESENTETENTEEG